MQSWDDVDNAIVLHGLEVLATLGDWSGGEDIQLVSGLVGLWMPFLPWNFVFEQQKRLGQFTMLFRRFLQVEALSDGGRGPIPNRVRGTAGGLSLFATIGAPRRHAIKNSVFLSLSSVASDTRSLVVDLPSA